MQLIRYFSKAKLPRTVFAIRAHLPGPDVERTYAWMRTVSRAEDIYVVVDEVGPHRHVWPEEYQVIRMSKEFLEEQKLFHEGLKVGWLCGDYFYYALRNVTKFDFAWLVEPDVVMNFPPRELFGSVSENSADLVGASVGKRNAAWSWHKTMTALGYADVFSVFYPMTRLSASLIDEMLAVRKEMYSIFDKNRDMKYPNDEAITGTVASLGNFTIFELSSIFNEMFTHFQYANKWLYPDVVGHLNGDKVVHPAVDEAKMGDHVLALVKGLTSRKIAQSDSLVKSLSLMDEKQKKYFIDVATEAFRKEMNRAAGR